MEHLKLTRTVNYGNNKVRFTPFLGSLGFISSLLHINGYSPPRRCEWESQKGKNSYVFVPNNGKYNVVLLNYENGLLEFYYTDPDGKKQNQITFRRIKRAIEEKVEMLNDIVSDWGVAS